MQAFSRLYAVACAVVVVAGCATNDPVTPPDTDPTFAARYSNLPNGPTCSPGTLRSDEQQQVLAHVNYIRSLHALPPVSYNPAGDMYTQQAALMLCENNTLSHTPPSSWKCWSPQGYTGCSQSNLWGGSGWTSSTLLPSSKDVINTLLIDDAVIGVGHRRWILNPFLHEISFGRVDKKLGGIYSSWAALKVFDSAEFPSTPLNGGGFAYPYMDYPKELVNPDWYLSFSTWISASYWDNNKVDYSHVTITVVDENNRSMNVHSIRYENDGVGLPNSLEWKVTGLQNNTRYTVTINGVSAPGYTIGSINYWFRLQ